MTVRTRPVTEPSPSTTLNSDADAAVELPEGPSTLVPDGTPQSSGASEINPLDPSASADQANAQKAVPTYPKAHLPTFGHLGSRLRFEIHRGVIAGPAGAIVNSDDPRWLKLGKRAWAFLAKRSKMVLDTGSDLAPIPSASKGYPLSTGDQVSVVYARRAGGLFGRLRTFRAAPLFIADVNHTRKRARWHDRPIYQSGPGWFTPAFAGGATVAVLTMTGGMFMTVGLRNIAAERDLTGLADAARRNTEWLTQLGNANGDLNTSLVGLAVITASTTFFAVMFFSFFRRRLFIRGLKRRMKADLAELARS